MVQDVLSPQSCPSSKWSIAIYPLFRALLYCISIRSRIFTLLRCILPVPAPVITAIMTNHTSQMHNSCYVSLHALLLDAWGICPATDVDGNALINISGVSAPLQLSSGNLVRLCHGEVGPGLGCYYANAD